MQIPKDAVLLRIFLGEADRYQGKPLYEAIVMKAREMGLAGATVIRGVMGYGRHSIVHTPAIDALVPPVSESSGTGRLVKSDAHLAAAAQDHSVLLSAGQNEGGGQRPGRTGSTVLAGPPRTARTPPPARRASSVS